MRHCCELEVSCLQTGRLTQVYECGEQVIRSVQAHMDREQEDDSDLVGKHQRCLCRMEAVSRKRCGHDRPEV